MTQDRIVAITGGFGVLGRAIAEAAISRGVRVALIDVAAERDPLEGSSLSLDCVDLTRVEGAEAAMRTIEDRLGELDALLNIAGGFRWEKVEGGSDDLWLDLHQINVMTARNASAAALPLLRRSSAGRIVNVGAAAALKSGLGMGAYAAAKSGVHRLTESLAEELKAEGITVNAVLPSIIDTPANRQDMPNAAFSEWISPAELAEVVLFLASKQASGVTGALVPVCGRL